MKGIAKKLIVAILTIVMIGNYCVNTYAINEIVDKYNENIESNEIQNEENTTKINQQYEKKENDVNNGVNNILNSLEENGNITSSNSIENSNMNQKLQSIDDENQEQTSVSTYSNGQTKENGVYKIAIGKDSSKTIEVAGSDTSNNAKIDIWNYVNALAQKFYFEYNEEGFYSNAYWKKLNSKR